MSKGTIVKLLSLLVMSLIAILVFFGGTTGHRQTVNRTTSTAVDAVVPKVNPKYPRIRRSPAMVFVRDAPAVHESIRISRLPKDELEELLERDRSALTVGYEAGCSPLLWALAGGNMENAYLLLEYGASVGPEGSAWTDELLAVACEAPKNQVQMVQMLLSCGARLGGGTRKPCKAILAATHTDSPLVQLLLEVGADPNCRYTFGQTLLHAASSSGHQSAAITELLLAYGAIPGIEDEFGQTPLTLAKMRGADKMADLLAEHRKELTILEAIALRKAGRVTALVQDDRTALTTTDAAGRSAMHYAVMYDQDELLEAFAENGLSPDIQDNSGATPLHYAADLCKSGMVAVLVEIGADVDQRDNSNVTALHNACERKCGLDVVKLLLNAGADVSLQGSDGCNALYIAARENNTEIMTLLIHRGAEPALDAHGRNLLHAAARNTDPGALQIGLDLGCNVNLQDEHGETPLHLAVSPFPVESIVRTLIDNDADPEARNNRGQTPIDTAEADWVRDMLKTAKQ